jgi:hypothetical protein
VNRFKYWRIEQNLRQSDVETMTHIKKWKIAMLDRGFVMLTANELKKISKVTGIESNQLTASASEKKMEESGEK